MGGHAACSVPRHIQRLRFALAILLKRRSRRSCLKMRPKVRTLANHWRPHVFGKINCSRIRANEVLSDPLARAHSTARLQAGCEASFSLLNSGFATGLSCHTERNVNICCIYRSQGQMCPAILPTLTLPLALATTQTETSLRTHWNKGR